MAIFSKTQIPITLSGAEWFALAIVLNDDRVRKAVAKSSLLSSEGTLMLRSAERTIGAAMSAASATADREDVVVPFSARGV
jgi:hypothetical protein